MNGADKYCSDVLSGNIPSGVNLKNAVNRYLKDRKNGWDFREDAVEKVVKFIHKLRHFTGKHDGKPFKLEPWQVFIVANLYGFYNKKEGTRRFQTAYFEMARKQGKALALETLLPTPEGFTSMAKIKIGDTLFDDQGSVTNVTYVSPIYNDRNCYEIIFEDGGKIIADADHQWFVKTKKNNKTKILTTKNLLDYKHNRTDGKGIEYRYRVPVNKIINLPEKELPINPYVLGLWLGDGNSDKPNFTVNINDLSLYDYVKSIYGNYKIYADKRRSNTLNISFAGDKGLNNSKLRHDLISAGVFGNKHIPYEYLRASFGQRLFLLQGLMDTDGSVSGGQCEFIQKSKYISDGFCELLSTLGIKYKRSIKIPKIKGIECEPIQRIQFYTDKRISCFRLSRKRDKLKNELSKRMLWKSIISIKNIESVPVRCITVDSDSSLYLCGDKFTVTHNTALVSALALYSLVADDEAAAEVLLAANSKDQARIAFKIVRAFAHGFDPDEHQVKRFRNDIVINNGLENAFIKTLAADSDKIDGYNCSVGIVDEYHSAPNSQVRDVIRSSQGMRVNPLLLTITTAGFDKSLPCYDLRTVATEIAAGIKEDESFLGVIYSLDEDDDWKDSNTWIKSNPNLGVTVDKSFLIKQVKQAINSPSDEVGVKTKNLNVWCDSVSVFIPDEYVVKATKKLNIEDFKGEECFVGVDLASNVDLTAVSYLFVRGDKYNFINDYYIPRETLSTRVHADIELYRQWAGNKYLKTTAGNVTDYDYITRDLLAVEAQSSIETVYYDKYNATSWAIQCTEQGLKLEPFSQTIGNFNNCTRAFERLMLGGQIFIDDNPITRYCLRNVELRYDFNGNCKPLKLNEKKKIDGVIAMLQALAAFIDASSNYRGTNIF